MPPAPTPWQIGFSCSLDCFYGSRESLDDEQWGWYVAASLELFAREAARLAHVEATRILRESEAEE